VRGSTSGWTPIVVVLAALAAVVLLAVGPASAQSVQSKREQAQAILAEIEALDMEVAQAAEAYNYARLELGRIDAELQANGRHLVAAKKSLVSAQGRISERLRDLYVHGDGDSTLEVILGARSLDEVITRLTAIDRVSTQDAELLDQVKAFRAEVQARRVELGQARADQTRLVAERAAQQEAIEGRLAERQRMYESAKAEIEQLLAEQRRREAAAAAAARARLAAQQLAAQEAVVSAADTAFAESSLPAAPPPDGSMASQVVAISMQYLGVPYVWGGSSPATGFDCSGFVSYVYAQVGISLPHHAASMYGHGVPVSSDDLQPADLVFFSGLGHMGMYIGGGQFIHAPHTGDVVKISSMSERWSSYVGARRVL
jgi:cell wall-associated NlpC family hydrolase/outer membrane murein-binding lipoprotein Lpp